MNTIAQSTDSIYTMPINLIYARSLNEVIGNGSGLPWRIPGDLARFKELTMDGIVVMGRKTWDSLPKKPLVGRVNIILSRQPASYEAPDVYWAASMSRVTDLIRQYPDKPVWVIGGADIYKQFEPMADYIYETVVMSNMVKGNVFYKHNRQVSLIREDARSQCVIDGKTTDVVNRILQVIK